MTGDSPASDSQIACMFCAEAISSSALVCFHCGRRQWKHRSLHLVSELAASIGVLLALGLLSISFLQVLLTGVQAFEARRDRIEAAAALAKAETALAEAERASALAVQVEKSLSEQRIMRHEINASFASLFRQVCSAVDGTFDTGQLSCLLPSGQYFPYLPPTSNQ